MTTHTASLFQRPHGQPSIGQEDSDRRRHRPYTAAVLLTVFVLLLSICELASAGAEASDALTIALEQARRDLETNTALERRAMNQLEALRRSRPADAEMLSDYETYLQYLQAMVAANRHLIEKLQALQYTHPQTTDALQSGSRTTAAEAPIPETALSDEVDELDRQLNASLSEFDEMLLKELDRIRLQSAPKMDALAQEASEAAERLREKGIDIGAGQSSAASDAETDPQRSDVDQTEAAMSSGKAGQDRDSKAPDVRAGQTAEGAEGDRQRQAQRPDGSDDDIVARQLREAAEQETDPELREKLWREYEAYKRGGH